MLQRLFHGSFRYVLGFAYLLTLTVAGQLPAHVGAVTKTGSSPSSGSTSCTNGTGNPTTYTQGTTPCIGSNGVDSNGNIVCLQTNPPTCNIDPSTCTSKTQPGCAHANVSQGIPALISNYANPLINTLAGVFGIFVTTVIVIGGIQYSQSADDPAKVSAARSRITNAVIALLAFLFLYTFLQWITPGGFLN